ncbi:putative sporulation protein YtxC [uncultured Clostridium sp.]|uniref:putative sporulation protein YtxC n=1 Tax=uncultured Clostridium sp. TaxID=59620 RepID=UPI00260C05AE|nr:putative sporulation protein YtxC [uncultured Clostridium sp.]
MLLVKIAYKNEENFIQDIQEVKEVLKNKGIKIGISEFIENDTHFIKVFCDDEDLQSKENVKNKILLYISNLIYRVIINNYRKNELFEYLTENYFFLKHEEIIEVDKKIKSVFESETYLKSERKLQCINKITEIENTINSFMKEDNFINIEGFMRFRVKTIRPILEDIVDKIIEEYMVEKEYDEFIDLLKYFVDIQESRIDDVNIFLMENGEYIVKDTDGKDLLNQFSNELLEDKEVGATSQEDVIISGLIANSPKCIKVYNQKYCLNEEFLITISKVFRDRVDFLESKNIL